MHKTVRGEKGQLPAHYVHHTCHCLPKPKATALFYSANQVQLSSIDSTIAGKLALLSSDS